MTGSALAAVGQWTGAGNLPSASSWYGQNEGAVTLSDGKVLVAGGADGSAAALAAAAVFDPTAETWAATNPLLTPRRLHTVTVLADGKVLVAGGVSGPAQFPAPGLASAELFDPAAGTWTGTGAMHQARWGHSAVALADGKVLVAGGTTIRSGQSIRALRSAEVYDPATGAWTEAAPMTDARSGHAAVVLGNGRILVAGGTVPVSRDDEAALAFCELYNAATDTWAPAGDLLAPRGRHQATLVTATTVLVTGGAAPGAPGDGTFDPNILATAELFTQGAGTWSAVTDMPGRRALHRAVLLGANKILVVGGTGDARDDAGYPSALIFDTATDTWATAAGLGTGRWAFAAAALPDDRVLVAGGVVGSGLAAATPDVDELTASTEIFSTEPVIG